MVKHVQSAKQNERYAFTLVELIIVTSIIGVLAAILLPVFAQVRERSRSAVCASNLQQISQATQLYAQDNNDGFPHGGDPCDLYTGGWTGTPYAHEVAGMEQVNDVLAPYIKTPELWHCPSDAGYTVCALGGSVKLTAEPTAYSDYGMSYLYNTNLPLQKQALSTVASFDPGPSYIEHGASEIILFGDAVGSWHGGSLLTEPRYNVLFADGHIASQTELQVRQAWRRKLTLP